VAESETVPVPPPADAPPHGPRTDGTSTRKTGPPSLLGISLTRAEVERIVLLSSLLFLSSLLLVVGRTTRDALFLTRYPVTWIAPMWLAVGVFSGVVAIAYERAIRRLPRARFASAFALGSAASYVALRVAIGQDVGPAYLVFAVWSEIVANLSAMLAWSIAQDLYDARRAKRMFGLLGAGRIAGTVVSGLGAGAIAPVIGTENLIFVLIAALLGVALLCRVTARRHLPAVPEHSGDRALEQKLPPLRRSRYVLAIAGTILVLYTVLTIGDYQFKAIARAAYPDRDSLARFMGTFYGAVGFVGLLVQFIVTPRMLDRFGVLGGAATMPVAFVTSSTLLLAFPSVAVAAVLKASDHALQFSIFDATLQLLLFPFPPAQRERVRALVFALMKPLGYGLGALLLVFLAPAVGRAGLDPAASASRLGWLSVPLGLSILPMLFAVRRGYVDAMRGTLMRGKLAEERAPHEGRLTGLLATALESSDAPQVLFAMDRLRSIEPDRLRAALPALAEHASPRVRAAAMRQAWSLAGPAAVTFARGRLVDPDPEVRSLAVQALAHALGEDAHEELVWLASQRDDAVRAAAIAALLGRCGLDGMLDGAPRLRALLDSEDAADRVVAARVLGIVGQPSLERAVGRLLADGDLPSLRRGSCPCSSLRSRIARSARPRRTPS
jgi:ATP/ADP translocase